MIDERKAIAIGKATAKDSNKLIIDYFSGGKSLTFWSRIAARRIHQPRLIIYYSTHSVFYVYLHYRYNTILLTIVLL